MKVGKIFRWDNTDEMLGEINEYLKPYNGEFWVERYRHNNMSLCLNQQTAKMRSMQFTKPGEFVVFDPYKTLPLNSYNKDSLFKKYDIKIQC
jgi:hypothetical protein